MVIGKYTQTRQRRLKAKIVKFSHDRHYKKGAFAVYSGKNDGEEEDRIKNLKTKK